MFIDLSRVPHEGQDVELAVPAERLPLEKFEPWVVGPVELAGRLDRADDVAFRLGGSLAATVELACVRCLESFRLEFHEPLDLLFLPFTANVGPGRPGKPAENQERELKDEDLAVSFYQDEKIDVALLIREQIYLALPMKPICRDDCQGLCSECGTNLNSSSCNCAREAVDPQLASLKSLLKP